MTLLHVYFALRKQQSFHRLLNGGPGQPSISASTSSGKSWKRAGALNSGIALEINALDTLGRSVLHLACTSTEASSLEYVRMLLAHPAINVNVLDKESHWTPLHRALYAGNISAAILLLKRLDIDTSIKDLEGYTAHDLYNSTVRSAKPTEDEETLAELFTWGTNRNAALGVGDGNDRAYPDQVVIPRKDDVARQHNRSLDDRFAPIHVRQVSMSKLHTVVLTSEPRDNIRVCGFGGGGRLGPSQHTQYALIPLPDIKHTIESVALGQDHTLALTSTGEVLTWGLNRFSQLGYVIEVSSSAKQDEHIQATPRKVGSLRREFVKGVAACKTASGCWTDTEVWTWGTNGGQLGYDKALVPVQVLPRKVSSIVKPVRAMVMTEILMACLLLTGEVVCVWSGGVSKISFPTQRFSSGISVYRPPQAINGQNITKLRSCDDTIAALSSNGEVFTFTSQPIGEGDSAKSSLTFKPQRIWALRRQFSAVQVGGLKFKYHAV
ncbi:regulator of chromosome condensation 1/beta-lactamase-inhibitor protein II [Suillus subalutaceus]|uniref:regulator of chromosome condensation 1/beta-lactamase-inhibitor protein II n=1 Tax=Suillus subalutaceus TaxID=48586 RepID=UPI001B87C1A1|nr:regulator of chromosome condensation 1/beta-lactamase-inhibitor protein II [Suillus subalutaceus]KAG1838584.1 regulator of chromosome condensation 1/beta-lactamase-inhibitor protein II [Suillus subalutaceus]